MDVSVVIVNWNVWDDAFRAAESVRATADRLSWEVILVDNASREDRSAAFRESFGDRFRFIKNERNEGFASACNRGASAATGRYILLLNPDARLPDGSLSQTVSYMDDRPEAGVLGCRLLNEDGSLQRWTAGTFPSLRTAFNHYFFVTNFFPGFSFARGIFLHGGVSSARDVDWVCGAFMLVRRKDWESLGGMDARYFLYGEDMEFCSRALRAGRKVVYFPAAAAIHASGSSVAGAGPERHRLGLRGVSQFYRSLHGGATLPVFQLIMAGGFLLRAVLYVLSGARVKAGSSWHFFRAAVSIIGEKAPSESAA